MKATVIGCGRWGSFIAWYLRKIGHEVTLYGREGSKHIEQFRQTRSNGLVTLEEDVTDTAQANKILLALCDSVASRMRADGRRCSCVTVTIRGNDFRNKSHQRKLPEPTDVTAEVFALSKTLFSELWDGYTPLRLLGVTLGDVSDNETVQLSMFQDDQKDRARKLDQTVDQLRSKFGVTAISRGSVTDATKRVGRKYKAQLEDDKPKQP